MQIVFFGALELIGWMLGDAFPPRRRTPLWARIVGAFLIVVGAFVGAALVTLAAAFALGFVQALGDRGN
jgi:hypothetical protein